MARRAATGQGLRPRDLVLSGWAPVSVDGPRGTRSGRRCRRAEGGAHREDAHGDEVPPVAGQQRGKPALPGHRPPAGGSWAISCCAATTTAARTGPVSVTWALTSAPSLAADTAGRGPGGRWRHGASRRGGSGAPRWSRPFAVLPTKVLSTCCRSNISRWCPSCSNVPAKKSILDLHNIESALVDSYARGPAVASPPLLFRAEAVALRRMERRTIGDFDHVLVVSEQEKARLPGGRPLRPGLSERPGAVGDPAGRIRAHRGVRGHHGMGPQRRRRRVAGPRDLAEGPGPSPRGPAAPHRQGSGAGRARLGRRSHRGDGDGCRREPVPGPSQGRRCSLAGRRRHPAEDHGGARRRASCRGHVGGLRGHGRPGGPRRGRGGHGIGTGGGDRRPPARPCPRRRAGPGRPRSRRGGHTWDAALAPLLEVVRPC